MQKLNNFVLPADFRGKSAFVTQLWWIVQSLLFALSPQFMYGWRRFLLRLFGANIGKNVIIRPNVRVTYPWKLSVGDYSWIGDYVEIYSLGNIEIGKNVVVSQKAYLCTGGHDYKKQSFDIFQKKIIIKDEVWVGADVFIAPGVTIEKGAVIGARSTVLEDMPENMVCVGYPAKPIKVRCE